MKQKHSHHKSAVGILRYIPLVLWVLFWGAAFAWILFASFSTTKEIFSNNLLGSGFHFENYAVLLQTRLFDLTEDAPPTLHFAIMADTLKHGLEQQIEQF